MVTILKFDMPISVAIEAGKWYILRRYTHSPNSTGYIVYVREVVGHAVHYVSYEQSKREPHAAEKTKNLPEFVRQAQQGLDLYQQWITDGYPEQADLFVIKNLLNSHMYYKRKPVVQPDRNLVKIKEIEFEGAESELYEWPVVTTSWDEAEAVITALADELEYRGGYTKTWLNLTFEDEFAFDWRIDVNPTHRSLAEDIYSQKAAVAGYNWWVGRDPTNYPEWPYNKPGSVEFVQEFLDTYDLNGWNWKDIPNEKGYELVPAPPIPPPEEKPIEEAPDSPYADRRVATKEERANLECMNFNLKETKRLIKADLKETFPNTKFSVVQRRSTYSSNIDVRWWDGPKQEDVKFLLGKYRSQGFDGMTDSTYYVYWLVNGQLTSYSGGYKDADRYYRLETYQKVMEEVCAEYGIDVPELEVSDYRTPKEAKRNVTNWNSPRPVPNPQIPETKDNYNHNGKYLSVVIEERLAELAFEIPVLHDVKVPSSMANQLDNLAEQQVGEIVATRYWDVWELSGDTYPIKDSIKALGNAKFDRRRQVWTIRELEAIPEFVTEEAHPRPLTYCGSVDGKLFLGIWDDHLRIWGDTRPVKDNLKREQLYWNGSQWVKNGTHLPQSMLDWFTYDMPYDVEQETPTENKDWEVLHFYNKDDNPEHLDKVTSLTISEAESLVETLKNQASEKYKYGIWESDKFVTPPTISFSFYKNPVKQQLRHDADIRVVMCKQEPPAEEDVEVRGDKAVADKFRKAADTLQKSIDSWENPDRLTNTAKRVRQAESAYAKAENARLLQSVMYNLADLHEAGDVPEELIGIKTKTIINRILTYPSFPHSWVYYSDLRDLELGTTGKRTNEETRLLAAWKSRKDKDSNKCFLKPEEMLIYADMVKKAEKGSMKYAQENYVWFKRFYDADVTELSYDKVREMIYNLAERKEKDPLDVAIHKAEMGLVGRKIDGFFPTPTDVIDKMLEYARIREHHKVLEPSAGIGHIAERLSGYVTAIEVVPSLAEILKLKAQKYGFDVECDDIFNYENQEEYDRVLMNPPFEKYQDVAHVKHVFDHLLSPGGRLVAIMAASAFNNSDKTAQSFRDWLDSKDSFYEKLPDGSFNKAFRSTGVNTYIVVINKES